MSKTKKPTEYFRKHSSKLLVAGGMILVVVVIMLLTTQTDGMSVVSPEPKTAEPAATHTDPVQSTTSSSSDVAGDQKHQDTSITSVDVATSTSQPEPQDPFAVSVKAESAIVWDLKERQALYTKQPDAEQPLASLTKLMTALVAAELANRGEGEEAVISRQHLDALGESGLTAGQTWNTSDLISFMLIESSNDAARAVAAASSEDKSDGYAKEFIDNMNNTAQELGLSSTYFFNPSGLDLNETLISGGYGTARNVAQLFSHILETNRDVLAPTTQTHHTFQSKEGLRYQANNTNTWLPRFSHTLGSKTGYTVLAGGNLVMGFDLEHPVVIVVLGSSRSGRFQDMQTLYNATQMYFQQESPTNRELNQ